MTKETAMKILKELHGNSLFSNRTALETLIPELAYDNDERIRKDIIAYIKKANSEPNHVLPSGSYCVLEMITWLRKQDEQKPAEQNGDNRKLYDIVIEELSKYSGNEVYKAPWALDSTGVQYPLYFAELGVKWQKEQKPVWSDEDEHRVEDTIYYLDTAKKHYASTIELDACIDWLKSLKDRIGG